MRSLSASCRRVVQALITLGASVAVGACGNLNIVAPANGSAVPNPAAATTVNVPITVDFTASTSARNIILDGNNFIIGAPGAFTTTAGGGASGWDRVTGAFPVAVGPHTLTASAEFTNWLRQTQQVSQTVSFSVAPGGGGGGLCTLNLSVAPATLVIERGKAGTTTVTRGGTCTGAVTVSASAPPTGVTTSPLTLASGQSSGMLTVNVSPSAVFQQTNLTVSGTAAPVTASQPLTLVVPRASGSFAEANPAPYMNSVIGSSTNSLSGTFTVDIKSGAQAGLPQPRAAQFRKGATNVGQAIGFTLGQTSNVGGAGFCRDNNTAQPALTRGVVMTSSPGGSNAQFGFSFVDLTGNANIVRQMLADSSKTNPVVVMQPRVFFSPDCSIGLAAGVNVLGPSNFSVTVQDLQTGSPLPGSCGSPISFNTATAFSALVKVQGNQSQVQVTVDQGTSQQICTYNVP